MDELTSASWRRWLFRSAGGTALASFGAFVWLITQGGHPVEPSIHSTPSEAPVASAPASANSADDDVGLFAQMIAVKNWRTAGQAGSLIFVCPGSAIEGRHVTLRRTDTSSFISGQVVAAPEWPFGCDAEGGATSSGARINIVLAPRNYLALASDGRWDTGVLSLTYDDPAELPDEALKPPTLVARQIGLR